MARTHPLSWSEGRFRPQHQERTRRGEWALFPVLRIPGLLRRFRPATPRKRGRPALTGRPWLMRLAGPADRLPSERDRRLRLLRLLPPVASRVGIISIDALLIIILVGRLRNVGTGSVIGDALPKGLQFHIVQRKTCRRQDVASPAPHARSTPRGCPSPFSAPTARQLRLRHARSRLCSGI